jgi:hypothetical protein
MRPRSKRRYDDGWQTKRVTDENFDAEFPPGEDRNIGILNGEPSSNCVDVDLDCREALLLAPKFLPATGWVFGRKSKPRSHWIYKVDAPSEIQQYADVKKQKDAGEDRNQLVELRSGGLTVYPPSTHKETGERIAWDQPFTQPANVSLVDLQRAVQKLAAACLIARHWPGKGSRDVAAMALSGGLTRAGWTEDEVSQFVAAVAEAAGDEEIGMRASKAEPTSQKHADGQKTTGWRKLIEVLGESGEAVVSRVQQWLDIRQKSKTTFRMPEPYQTFPVESLPAPIAEYVTQAAKALGCDPAYIALPVLAVLASAIGNTRTIRLKRGWREPSIVWSATVGDSGTMKSPAYEKAVRYVTRKQKQLLVEYKQLMEDHQARAHQANEGANAPGPLPREPVLRRVICSDTTIEKLAETLEDNPRGILVARDELACWLGSFIRYKGRNGGTDAPNWLELHRAGQIMQDRKTGDRRTIIVYPATASVTGTIQPGTLARALTADYFDAGLSARLLMAMPDKRPKKWSEIDIDPDVEKDYEDVIDQLLELGFDTDERGEERPHALNLSPDAKNRWIAFYDEWASEQALVDGELAAAYSKLEAYAARFALIHHVVKCVAAGTDDCSEIGTESVAAGIALVRWFARETRRIYAVLSESEEAREIRRLVEFIRSKGGRITTKVLQQSNSRRYPTAEAAEDKLNALVKAGVATWQEVPVSSRGGRPTKECLLATFDESSDDTSPSQHNSNVSDSFVGIVGSRNDDEWSFGPANGSKGHAPKMEVLADGAVGQGPRSSVHPGSIEANYAHTTNGQAEPLVSAVNGSLFGEPDSPDEIIEGTL